MKQLIVIGNGFDIHCGLKSSYSDFFMDRFETLFCTDKENTKQIEELEDDLDKKRCEILSFISKIRGQLNFSSNDNNDCDYFKRYKKKFFSEKRDITRWDLFFLFADACVDKSVNNYEWQDVESLIFDVISIALNANGAYKMNYAENVSIGPREDKGIKLFSKLVYDLSFTGRDTTEEITAELLKELKKFENIFAEYITNQIDLNQTNSGYIDNAIMLYKHISKYNLSNSNFKSDKVDVLSFNYSLDDRFKDILDKETDDNRLETWSNIHGIAHGEKTPYYPAPIFGIDSHGIISQNGKLDLRVSFTKAYRVIENEINDIRSSSGYAGEDLITIYGHSLGVADYSYFEAIFDENNLYYSDCKIEYYYYPGKNNQEKLIKRQEAITRLYNLLTNYGNSLSETHGDNIVNKLNLENRLRVIPSE